jgi:hypothetical protein
VILGQNMRWHAQQGIEHPEHAVMMLESILEILEHSREVTEKVTVDNGGSPSRPGRFVVINYKARIVLDD